MYEIGSVFDNENHRAADDNMDICLNPYNTAFQEAITTLLLRMRFYKYYDKKYYNLLQQEVQQLEDYIVNNDGKLFEIDEQAKVVDKISQSTERIYKLVFKKYSG